MTKDRIGDDIVDLRDIAKEEEQAWRDAIAASGYEFDRVEKEEPTIILDSYFEDYARELAEDIGAINGDEKWPLTCIDWDEATQQLKYDYTNFEIDGLTYWFRAF